MYRFSGWHNHTIDQKGRTSVPAPFREMLKVNGDAEVVVARSMTGKCLEVYPGSVWNEMLDRMGSLPTTNTSVTSFRRLFVSSAAPAAAPDKAGRIMLPVALRDYAGLKKDVKIVGNINRMEIWDPDVWDQMEAKALEEQKEELLETMREFGI